jgi:hypothetical protein
VPDDLTLEEAWRRAGQHAELARNLAGVTLPATRIPFVPGTPRPYRADRDSDLGISLALAHAQIAEVYAAMAQAAATGLQSDDLDLRRRWQNLANPHPRVADGDRA